MSRAGDIGDAVVTAIDALALSGVPAAVRLKTPSLPQGVDPPQVVVTCNKTPRTEFLTADSYLDTYDCAVTVYGANDAALADDDTFRANAQAIAAALKRWQAFAGVPYFNDANVTAEEIFPRDLLDKTLNRAVISFTVEIKEPRS